jgi:hypothetical protein
MLFSWIGHGVNHGVNLAILITFWLNFKKFDIKYYSFGKIWQNENNIICAKVTQVLQYPQSFSWCIVCPFCFEFTLWFYNLALQMKGPTLPLNHMTFSRLLVAYTFVHASWCILKMKSCIPKTPLVRTNIN